LKQERPLAYKNRSCEVFSIINSSAGWQHIITPLLKWPGGKRKLVQFIRPLVPANFRDYYEPFVGSGALFFALGPKRAFLSDRNQDLISTYTQIRDNPKAVINHLSRLKNSERCYYATRSSVPKSDSQRAARFIYLSALSFNGIHRVNLKGIFNVPYGYKTHLEPCEPKKIREVSDALRGAQIACQDFEAAVAHAQQGDLVYLDPPYTTAHANNGFLKYNAKIFTWEDQRRLAHTASVLAKRGCFVVISNANHSSIRDLYRGFGVLEICRYSVIAASGNFRRRITECLFRNAGKQRA
jgi:DNA adenine methylase